MSLLSKTAILAANDLKSEDIKVPEWDGAVRVRSFTGLSAMRSKPAWSEARAVTARLT